MKSIILGVLVALTLSLGVASAQQDAGAPDTGPLDATALINKAAYNQGHSLYVRDRCRYEQRLLMERYKYDKKTEQPGDLVAKRQTTVVVEPAQQPDETGQIPVLTRVVDDTNDKGEPKDKVDPNARTGLASEAFLDEVFFPLVPENIDFMTFQEVPSNATGERWFKFAPKTDAQPDRPLASGIVQLSATTGEVLTMRISGFSNLKAIDKHLDKILSFTAVIDYSQFGGTLRMPTAANGSGVSDVSRFDGYFKFIFEEGKYAPVLKVE
jgi:hypothetical protein